MKHEIGELHQMQSLSLNSKVAMTITRVKGWLKAFDDQCYISFSGGKDSTVLVDIIHNKMGRTDIPLVFVDTGLEYPEVRDFVKTYGDKVVWLKPRMNFRQVIERYGYPMFSKETSEVVYNAKKYLKKLAESETIARQTDRQTDRQTPYAQFYRKITGTGEYSKFYMTPADEEAMKNISRGGADAKYRKLRGLGEFSKVKRQVGYALPCIDNVGDIRDTLGQEEKGDYP